MRKIATLLFAALLLVGCQNVQKYTDNDVTCYVTDTFPWKVSPGGIDCDFDE